jgi:hypothetical protein
VIVHGRALLLWLLVALAAAASGCGSTEESGEVGDVLSAKGLDVSVERVDTAVPVPPDDITGLSRPSPGSELVGVLVRVCSDHGGAIGTSNFGLETSTGDARHRFLQRNYARSLEVVRSDCGGGWVVFEIPVGSRPERVTFGFVDTGSAYEGQNDVDARFSWSVG